MRGQVRLSTGATSEVQHRLHDLLRVAGLLRMRRVEATLWHYDTKWTVLDLTLLCRNFLPVGFNA
jgi:hypothetical protein